MRVAVFLEHHPGASIRDVAAAFGAPWHRARRWIDALYRRGFVREVTAINFEAAGRVHGLTRLRVELADPLALAALETRVAQDPCVYTAVILSGRWDFELQSQHESLRAFGAWQDGYRKPPVVAAESHVWGRLVFRRSMAAALVPER